MHEESISLFGENQKQISIGEIVLGMLHNIRMLIGSEMQTLGWRTQKENDIKQEVPQLCDR